MRRLWIAIAMFSSVMASMSASALEARGSMRSWKQASVEERSELLDHLLGKSSRDAEYGAILKCLDETSNIAGHTDLPIDEVAEACRKVGDAGQPV